MVQRYVKFGNFRSPVAASFAALQKVRSAPPVTGLLLSAVRRLLFAAYSPPASTVRRPPFAACCLCLLFAARCSPPAVRCPLLSAHPPRSASTVRRPPFAACCLCLLFAARRLPFAARCLSPATTVRHPLFAARPLPPALCRPLPQPADRRLSFATLRPLLSARYSPPATLRPPPLPATLRLPPQPAITTRRPQTAAARVDSSPANPLLSGYALNRSHMCAKRRSMLFCLASDVVETEFLFIFVQINKGKQLFIPLADRGTSSGDCLNRVWLLSVLCYASTSWWGRHGHGTIFLFRLLEACIERDRLALFCWKQSRAVIIPGRRPPLHHGRDF